MTISSSPYREAAEKPWAKLKKRHRRLLDLMADGEWYLGRDLKQHLGYWGANSVYVHLHELEKLGWVESQPDYENTFVAADKAYTPQRYRLKLGANQ